MVAELTPGTRRPGELPEGERIPISQTLPDVNLDEVLAALDSDTRDYLRLLLGDGATGAEGQRPRVRRRPSAGSSRPRATRARSNELLALRRRNLKRAVHNLSLVMEALGAKDTQLAEFVESSNAVFATLARQEADLRATLAELPTALDATQSALAKTDRMADRARADAREPPARRAGARPVTASRRARS